MSEIQRAIVRSENKPVANVGNFFLFRKYTEAWVIQFCSLIFAPKMRWMRQQISRKQGAYLFVTFDLVRFYEDFVW